MKSEASRTDKPDQEVSLAQSAENEGATVADLKAKLIDQGEEGYVLVLYEGAFADWSANHVRVKLPWKVAAKLLYQHSEYLRMEGETQLCVISDLEEKVQKGKE